MAEASQTTDTMNVKTTGGQVVEISLEDWVKTVIREAHAEQMKNCPFIVVNGQERVNRLEWEMGVVKWVGSTISALAIAHIFYTFVQLVK